MFPFLHKKCRLKIKDVEKNFLEEIWVLKNELDNKNNHIDQLKVQIQRFEFLVNNRFQEESILTIDQTKRGSKVIVKEVVNKLGYEIEIFDIDVNQYNKSRELVLWANVGRNSLFITDIQNQAGSHKGHGSLALKYLDRFASGNKKSIIQGEISSVDFDHIDHLVEFYIKNGYEIVKNKKGRPISISKEINYSSLKL